MQEASFVDDEYGNREPGGNDHHWRGFWGERGNMSLRMGKCLKIGPVRSGRGLGCWRYRGRREQECGYDSREGNGMNKGLTFDRGMRPHYVVRARRWDFFSILAR